MTDTTAAATQKTKNVFDITDFGAVGDGCTDCTAAIQAALDEAARVEGTVLVPPGKYCTGKLKLGVRTRLEGYSGWNYRQNGLSTLILNDFSILHQIRVF